MWSAKVVAVVYYRGWWSTSIVSDCQALDVVCQDCGCGLLQRLVVHMPFVSTVRLWMWSITEADVPHAFCFNCQTVDVVYYRG